VLKLLAMRSQDQRDIALLVDLLGDSLDWPYIEHWAAVWDVVANLRVFRPAPVESSPVGHSQSRPAAE
jgi:hypothetical protein